MQEALYREPQSIAELRAEKAAVFASLRADYGQLRAAWGGNPGYDALFDAELNNARLASFSLYDNLLPAFERLLAKLGGDLPRFYQEVAVLGTLDAETRRATLAQFAASQRRRRSVMKRISASTSRTTLSLSAN